VRDNIHSADLISAFEAVAAKSPRPGSVYNIGGGRDVNCSMLEAVDRCQEIAGRPLDWAYSEHNRIGDHIWWISDLGAFRRDYPNWRLRYDIDTMLREIHDHNRERWLAG